MSDNSSTTNDHEGTDDTNAIVDQDRIIRRIGQITDRFGNVVYFGNVGDYWLPALLNVPDLDFRKLARKVRDTEIRPDDILVCSYPKTGLHWIREIILMLKNNTSAYADQDSTTHGFLELDHLMPVETLPSPRLLMTHAPFRYWPRQALQKKIKIVCLDRNPKDTFVSYYNHMYDFAPPMNYPGTFQQFFSFYFECGFHFGDLFDHLMERQEGLEANPDLDVFFSVFEDRKRDLVGGVKQLNNFLGTGCSDQLCEDIALACTFKKMKSFKEDNTNESETKMYKTKKTPVYRKGDVGDWKNWFTVAMNEEFDAEYKKRMSNYKRTYTYTL